MVAFNSIYCSDSLTIQMTYMRETTYQNLSQSQIGILQSIIYLPSIITPLLVAPIIEKLGWFNTGCICQLIFLLASVAMQFVYNNFTLLLISRLIFGLANEASWLVQSTLITEKLEEKYQPMAFGTCMSISTSAQLVGFFIIPFIFKNDKLEYDFKVKITFLCNILMCILCFSLFLVLSFLIIRINKNKATNNQQNDSKEKQQKTKFTFKFKLQMMFNTSLYVYIQSFIFSILLSCCYGCQTQIFSYLLANGYSDTRVNINGVIRSLMSVVGGPLFGSITTKWGKRIAQEHVLYIGGIIGFILLFIKQIPIEIPLIIIGMCDGGSPCTSKSTVNNLSTVHQRINGMAISGCIFNICLTAFPYFSGMTSIYSTFRQMDGIIFFYLIMLIVGLVLSLYMEFVNKYRFDNKMNAKDL